MQKFRALFTFILGTGLACSAVAQPSGILRLYTSQPSDQIAAATEAFNKLNPAVKVEVFRSGTTEVMNKLQAEFAAGRPQADVVLLADDVALTQLKNDGRLLAYPDLPLGNVPANLVDADKTFFGTKLITTGIVYNTNLVRTPPKSWKDLLAPEVASKTILPSPLYSGAAVIHLGTMVQNPEFGWPYVEALAKNRAMAGRGNGAVIESVARGEKAYGIIIDYMAMNAKAQGSPVEFVFPVEGVSVITQPVAILKTTRNPEAAKAFVAWQFSDEAQQQSIAQGYFPVNPALTPPKGYPEVSKLKFLKSDTDRLLKADEENKLKFAELFGG
jgi:iron(III) transport system substrate-binding protein